SREEFEVIARTFLAAFPHVTLWRNDFYPNRPVLGLVGAQRPLRVDLERVGARLAGLPAWGRDSLLAAPRAIGMLYVADLSSRPDAIPAGPVTRDDRPVLEFLAPRLTRTSARRRRPSSPTSAATWDGCARSRSGCASSCSRWSSGWARHQRPPEIADDAPPPAGAPRPRARRRLRRPRGAARPVRQHHGA